MVAPAPLKAATHPPCSSILLQFPGLTLRVGAGDQQRLRGTFRDILGSFTVPQGGADVTLQVGAAGYIVTNREGVILSGAAMELNEPGISLEEAALRTYIGCCTDRLLVHAAGLVRDDQVVMLAAPSTHGKTTLTLALLARGWRFMSDEIVPISQDDWRAAPFPRALHIRRPSLAVLEQQGFLPELSHVVSLLHTDRQPVLGIPLHQEPLASRRSIAAIVFISYTPGALAVPVLMPPALAASGLLQQALNGGTLGSRAFTSAIALARQAPCYRLAVSALGPAVTAIEALVR